MNDRDDGAESPEDPNEDDALEERIQLTPEQTENLRRTMANLQRSLAPHSNLPKVTWAASARKNAADLSGIIEVRQASFAAAFKSVLETQAAGQKKISASISSDLVGRMAEQLTKNIEFGRIVSSLDIVAKVNATFVKHQQSLFESLGPALKELRARFYPSNLRAIEDLKFEDVNTVVMIDGVPLYGVPRAATAEALTRAESESKQDDFGGLPGGRPGLLLELGRVVCPVRGDSDRRHRSRTHGCGAGPRRIIDRHDRPRLLRRHQPPPYAVQTTTTAKLTTRSSFGTT